jgi:hypothetical protein
MYSAFGLQVDLEIAMRAMPITNKGREPRRHNQHRRPEPEWTSTARKREHAFEFEIEGPEVRFWFRNLWTFVARDGEAITAMPQVAVGRALLPLYVEVMVMAMVLSPSRNFRSPGKRNQNSICRYSVCGVDRSREIHLPRRSICGAAAFLTDDNAAIA